MPLWVYLTPLAILAISGLVRFVMWNDKLDYPVGHFMPDNRDNERTWNRGAE